MAYYNAIKQVRTLLISRFPGLNAEMDAPSDPHGLWVLDVRPKDGPWIVVEWRPGMGFGISTPGGDDFGTKSDEIHLNVVSSPSIVADRVAALIKTRARTEPPRVETLAGLRMLMGFNQSEIGANAGIKQPAVARIESRKDIKVSTARLYVAAMGGKLRLLAAMPDGSEFDLSGIGEAHVTRRSSRVKKPPASSKKKNERKPKLGEA